ncbi:glycosyltransferase [Solirubrobacter soli]|uniref:glycosyltransferase n=1 Tax=Solirubrobacter soli TaxID=363832 RepID=UPI00041FEA9B|nr:nucleotide disphospho-sugar-binding domain-containing protein [Solirubrobacter soli]
MARILAYTTPATGHVFPLVPGLLALKQRGHEVKLIANAEHVEQLRAAGLDAAAVDQSTAKAITDYEVQGRDRLHRGLRDLLGRGEEQRADLERHIDAYGPDVLLIDTIAYGAAIGAERSGLPWASVMPSLIPFPGKGIPPYGLGLKPMGGPLGALRDKLLLRVVLREYSKAMLPRLNALRVNARLDPVKDPIENLYRPHRILALTGEPLEYARTDTPAHVRFVGAQLWDPPAEAPAWLDEPGDPWVLVTCSTEYQGDEALAAAAIEGLRDEPVRVLVTLADAHGAGELPQADNVRVERFVAHGPVLERAAAVVCHGGMGIVQKAVAAGVPIVAVPFGRDQPEVGRRIAEAKLGVLVKQKDLNAARIRSAVRRARTMRPVVVPSGGPAEFAGAVEEIIPAGLELEAHCDRSLIG